MLGGGGQHISRWVTSRREVASMGGRKLEGVTARVDIRGCDICGGGADILGMTRQKGSKTHQWRFVHEAKNQHSLCSLLFRASS